MIRVSELLLTSSVLILGVLALSRLGRGRLSRRVCYGLWLAVLVRLLVPVSLPLPGSVLDLPPARAAEEYLAEQVRVLTPDGTVPQAAPSPADPGSASPESGGTGLSLAGWVWLGGAAVTAGWFWTCRRRLTRQLRRTRQRLEIPECPLPVWVTRAVPSPCLVGVLRPEIYLTPEAAEDPDRRRHVLTHELCHWRQGDPIWTAARCLCLVLYWFDPLVWLAASASRQDGELACDELAVRTLGQAEAVPYGRTLVELVRARQFPGDLGTMAISMSVGRRGLRERIRLIAAAPVTRKSALAGLVLALGVLVSCTFSGGADLTGAQALEALMDSVRYESGIVSFTVPGDYAPASDWEIQVRGLAAEGDGYAAVRLFEEESGGNAWEPGKTYSIDLSETRYDQLWLEATLRGLSQGTAVDLLAEAGGGPVTAALPEGYTLTAVQMPFYTLEGDPELTPFELRLALPEGWELRQPETVDPSRRINNLQSDLELWAGETWVGTVACSGYEPYDGELPAGEEYKTVYTSLRLSSAEQWDSYTVLRTLDAGETARMTVEYLDQGWLEGNPGQSAAAAPVLETTGLVSFNRELGVYVALRLSPQASVPEETLDTIAGSIRLSPIA